MIGVVTCRAPSIDEGPVPEVGYSISSASNICPSFWWLTPLVYRRMLHPQHESDFCSDCGSRLEDGPGVLIVKETKMLNMSCRSFSFLRNQFLLLSNEHNSMSVILFFFSMCWGVRGEHMLYFSHRASAWISCSATIYPFAVIIMTLPTVGGCR